MPSTAYAAIEGEDTLQDRISATANPLDGLRAATPISEAMAVDLVAAHYGLKGTVQRLDSERDQNFMLRTADERKFVLKIANPAEDRIVTHLQTSALRHIAARDPSLPVPRIVSAMNGDHECDVVFEDGSRRVVRLLTFLAGTPLQKVASSVSLRRNVGRCAAQLAMALKDFHHAGADHKLLWDIQYAADLRPLLSSTQSHQREAIERILNRFESVALPGLASLPQQPVHNDLNPNNIMVDPDTGSQVCGIIDFGDLTATARINDLAIACAYQIADHDDPLGPALDVIGAYHEVSPLNRGERAILFDLIATRLVMTILISSARAARYPDNAGYILRHNLPASARLSRIGSLARADAQLQIDQACERGAMP